MWEMATAPCSPRALLTLLMHCEISASSAPFFCVSDFCFGGKCRHHTEVEGNTVTLLALLCKYQAYMVRSPHIERDGFSSRWCAQKITAHTP